VARHPPAAEVNERKHFGETIVRARHGDEFHFLTILQARDRPIGNSARREVE
jgi:hypothetical protein